MPARLRALASAALGQVPTLVTLAALASIFFWGMHNHWRLPSFAALTRGGEASKEQEGAKGTDVEVNNALPAAGGLCYLAAFRNDHKSVHFASEEAAEKAGLKLAESRELALHDEVHANGTIDYDPDTYAHLSARATGMVWRVYKQLGQPVGKGELLALVESAEVGKAKADFLQSLTQYDLRLHTLQQLQGSSSAVPEIRLREAESMLRESRVRLFNDTQALRNLGLEVDQGKLLALPDERRVEYLQFLGLDEAARKRISGETATANLLPLSAPFAGEVVQRNVARGEAVAPGRPLFVVADLDHVHLELAVEPRDVSRLRIGQTITFTPEESPRAVASGKLAHIGPEVDEKTRRVWVHCEAENPTDPERRLRPHTFGTGRVLIASRPRAVVVPAAAVQSEAGASVVFVRVAQASRDSDDVPAGESTEPEGVRFQARTVQTGQRVGDLVEIVRGVVAGERVVTTGGFALKSALNSDRIAGDD